MMINYWYIVLAGVTLLGVAVAYHYRSHQGRRFWDRLLLRMPVFGLFIRNAVFARFARMLGMMLKSGVNILLGLELIAQIVDNSIVSDSILRIKDQVERGDPMAEKMRQEGIYPILIVQLVRVGEESGKMDELLLQIAEFYDAELAMMAKNVETMIEPIFIFILGFFVLIMALGIFLPMWNLFSVIQKAAV
jgi:MSHA biogenesis protein MshG